MHCELLVNLKKAEDAGHSFLNPDHAKKLQILRKSNMTEKWLCIPY